MKTPLTAWQQTQGAVLVNDRGIELPERFSHPQEEYQAVCEKAGLINLSFRSQIRMTGEDRVAFLQGMVSNDVKALQPGDGCAATLLTEQGRIVADLRVYALDTCLLLDVDTRSKEKLIEALSRFIVADDVEMADLSETQTTLALQGPLSSQVLAAAGISTPPSKMFQHCEATLAETSVHLIRANDTGEDGYEIFAPSVQAVSLWQALLQAGASLGLRPVGLAALNTLRIEAGIPWYGVDMDESRIVLEVGLDEAISFKKGCYLGQEVVERATARGHVNRKLTGLVVQDDTLPASGDKLFDDSQEVGWVTSATVSPRLGRPIALGYVRREHLAPGTRLRIDRQGTPVIAEVTALPFSR
ncbi:MAG: aminomethyl transferase family protein [Deltaproteobacteria bacterium]|nr:aminomethyl transferase family protein [Deltaproteobacteria bacterium]